MNSVKIHDLYKRDYSIQVINACKQFWRDRDVFNCIGSPKKVSLLLYIDGFDAEYELKDGRRIKAHSGNIVYTPTGAEYKVIIKNPQNKKSNTIGINFHMIDNNGEPFILSEDITVFNTKDKSYSILFNKVDEYSERSIANYGRMKAGVYDILSNLSQEANFDASDKYSIISKGILYIEQESDENLSVSEIASLCNVSQAYFRRLFKEYSGLTPIEYRLHHKIERAKTYLEHEYISVAEIAERLSFYDVSYFIKVFKQKIGVTPLEYRKEHQL